MKTQISQLIQAFANECKDWNTYKSVDFRFEKTIALFNNYKSFDIEPIKSILNTVIDSIAQSKKFSFQAILDNYKEDAIVTDFLLLIGKLISMIDKNGFNKKLWNEYEDKRTLAKTFIRQNVWTEAFIKYKLSENVFTGHTEGVVGNVFDYLENPFEKLNIYSENHKKLIIEFFFKQEYNKESFHNIITEYFREYFQDIANSNNIVILITDFFYSSQIKELWFPQIQGVLLTDTTNWQDNHIAALKNNEYCIIWNSKKPIRNNTIAFLRKIIGEGETFDIYYLHDQSAVYKAQVIDFCIDSQEYINKNWESKSNLIYGLEDKFEDYIGDNKKASIVFLVSEFVKLIQPIDKYKFQLFGNYDYPRHDNIVPFQYIKQFDINMEDTEDENTTKYPLNLILFGPPGTGKTYNAIPLAVSIIEPEFMESFKNSPTFSSEQWVDIKNKYDNLKDEKFIEFVTFHQSMSYEDFIEGIKPVISITNKEYIYYEYVDGIFKRAAKKAIQEIINILKPKIEASEYIETFDDYYSQYLVYLKKQHTESNPYKFEMVGGTKIVLLDFIEFDGIKIKYEKGINPDEKGKQELNVQKDYLKKLYESGIPPNDFKGQIRKKMVDIVGYCGHPSPYWAVYNDFFNYINPDYSKIQNDKSEESDYISGEITFSQYMDLIKKVDFGDTQVKELLKSASPVVLIIDEINRGNIANIFGELITLIEAGKRIGESEMITVRLPYSKTEFSVPPNLYIIGTMNTADRSVEALDTALRRRFSFIEKTPQPELLTDKTDYGINLRQLLTSINERIKILLNKDHCIGHSYFLFVKTEQDLLDVFRDKLIPLLQEYFYNDFGKIRLILGDAFVKFVNDKIKFAVSDESVPEFDGHYIIKQINHVSFIDDVKKIYS